MPNSPEWVLGVKGQPGFPCWRFQAVKVGIFKRKADTPPHWKRNCNSVMRVEFLTPGANRHALDLVKDWAKSRPPPYLVLGKDSEWWGRMDLRLLFREVPAPGDLFLLSWRPCVLPHPSQLPGVQFGLLRANCLCWGKEILLCRADKIKNLIKGGLKPLGLFWLLSGAVATQDGRWRGWLCLGAMTEGFSQREAATEVCVTYVCLPVEKV